MRCLTSEKAENSTEEERAEPGELLSCGSVITHKTVCEPDRHSAGKRDVVVGHVVRRVEDHVDSSRDKSGRVGRVVIRLYSVNRTPSRVTFSRVCPHA